MNNHDFRALRGTMLKAEKLAPDSPATKRLRAQYEKTKATRRAAAKMGRVPCDPAPVRISATISGEDNDWLDAQPAPKAALIREAVREYVKARRG